MKNEELKKKLDNFWFYYKNYVFVGIFLAITVAICIYSACNVTKPKYKRTVVFMGQNMNTDKRKNIEDELLYNIDFLQFNKAGEAKAQGQAINLFAYDNLKGNYDVAVLDKNQFTSFSKKNSFLKLDDYIKSGKLTNVSGVQVEMNKKSDSGTYGIEIKKSKVLDNLQFETKDKVIAIYIKSKCIDKDIELVNSINQ